MWGPTASLSRARAPSCSLAGPRLRACSVRPLCGLRSVRSCSTATAQDAYSEEDLFNAESDFYDILGVSPTADAKAIKKAYREMMMECHPDFSQDADESTQFCVLLNEIYDTLMDDEKRALYDELAGFSDDSINPFLDTTYPRESVFVDEVSCIGCRNCNNVCPKTFEMEDDYGRARAMAQNIDTPEKLQEAIDTCPVSCIHWVTEPQLSLLEAAMARMERLPVYALMSSGRNLNMDVFTEASYTWTKRQAAQRKRREEREETSWVWGADVANGPATGSTFYSQAGKARARAEARASGGAEGGGLGDRESRNIANLAAKAARATRSYRDYQRAASAVRNKATKSLSSVSSASSMDSMDMI